MGKKGNKNKNKKHNNRSKSNGNWTQDRVNGYTKTNEKLWEFYKRQGLIPEGEWDTFVETLKIDLPVSFRIQGCHKDREILRTELEQRYIAPIAASGDTGAFEPKPLPWYEGAYQTPMSRSEVRAHPTLSALHNFLVTEAELGNISRQEAVSMIPPLLLKPEAHHHVLDVCAAPGSKTMQLIEMMHENDPNPSGFVVANDVDKSRCYLLCHQILKRMKSANCVVICEDGAIMPNMKWKDDTVLKFDRVLCDVICSGDGTVRKNPDIWTKWTPQDGLGLHRLQLSIARRSVQQLKVGGLMVYSTCSMNPMEDEAVVAQLIREGKGALRLVDAHPRLPGMKAQRGVSTWKVIDRDMKEYGTVADIPTEGPLSRALVPSMWPPTEEEAKEFNLANVMRVLPHTQNTGGFFVALIERVSEDGEDKERREVAKAPNYKRQKMFKDEPFTFLKKDDERWDDLKAYYGIDDSFPYENLFNRMLEEDSNARQLFFVNVGVKEFILRNMSALSIQNAGMKMFGRNENKVEKVRYRISQEGVETLHRYMTKQKMRIPKEDMLVLLKAAAAKTDGKALVDMELLQAKDELRQLKSGSVVLYVDETRPVCAWIGQRTAAPYIGKEERIHHLRLLGEDVDSMELLQKTKRKEKAMRDREAAYAEQEAEKAAKAKEESIDENVDDTVHSDKKHAHSADSADAAPDAEGDVKRIKLDDEGAEE